jgi:hypothetical protein
MTWRDMCDPGIAQHDFAHQLRGPVGRGRRGGIVLADRYALRFAVDVKAKTKYRAPALTAALIRVRELTVFAVVAERIADQVWHDDRGGEMDNGVNGEMDNGVNDVLR